MRLPSSLRLLSLAAAALVLAACADHADPLRPDLETPDTPPDALISVACTASLERRTVRCGEAGIGDGGASAVVLGGQYQYVELTSSNITVTADTFAFDVTVENLIPQPLGTTDGTNPHGQGVRLFFLSGPTSTTGGTITVANPDGVGTFTAAGQPYFQYEGLLESETISEVKRWKLQFSQEVAEFTFVVLVSAEVQYPDGYVDDLPWVVSLNPGETRAIGATARTFVGNVIPGAPISWMSDAPSLVSVSGGQVTAGATTGFAMLTASSGALQGVYPSPVSICPSTTVTGGTSLPSSIATTDCFSSFGSSEFQPSSSYYADLYRVTLTAGQTVTITMDSGDQLDTYLVLAELYSGIPLAANDDDEDEVLGVGSKVVFTAPVTSVYVIEASTFNGLDTGSYTLGVTIN